jgi:2'-5' RNA ligase
MKKYIAICLIPAKKDKLIFDVIIKTLANKYYTYPFIPHITMYAGMHMEENRARLLINQIFNEISLEPITADVAGLYYSDIFTKTLYVNFQINSALQNIHQLLKNKFGSYQEYLLHPHLSLIYKNKMPAKEKVRLKNKLSFPTKVRFDQIYIISSSKHITDEADVLKWEIVMRKKLH